MVFQSVGLDIGGTKTLGVTLQDGEVVKSIKIPTLQDRARLLESLRTLADDLGAAVSVGVGIPGPVSPGGVILAAPNLPCIVGLAATDISQALGRRIRIGNDAKCATLAEWKLGAGENINNLVLLAFGTGIGAGFVLNGKLVVGSTGFAGEIGHMIVDPNGPECSCGQRGCWEQLASGRALSVLAQQGFQESWLPNRSAPDGPSRHPVGEDLVAAARVGNQNALSILDNLARWMALGIINVLNIFDPERVIIVGGLAAAADVLLPRVEKWRKRLGRGFGGRQTALIIRGALGDGAGAIGAALLTECLQDIVPSS